MPSLYMSAQPGIGLPQTVQQAERAVARSQEEQHSERPPSTLLAHGTEDLLSRCFDIVAKRHRGQKEGGSSFFLRSPYARIGHEAAGPLGSALVSISQASTQFSVLVVFLLISGTNLNFIFPSQTSAFYSIVCTVRKVLPASSYPIFFFTYSYSSFVFPPPARRGLPP